MSGIYRRTVYNRYVEAGHITWQPFTMPVVCLSNIYNTCIGKELELPILIADYRSSNYANGYPTATNGTGPISDFVDDINTAILGDIPETWQNGSNIMKLSKNGYRFFANSVAVEDGTALGIMESFNVNRYDTDEMFDFFFDKVDQASHRIGYSDFRLPVPMPDARGSKNIRGAISMSGNQDPVNYNLIPYLTYNRLFVPVTEGSQAVDQSCYYTMLVWPDKIAGQVTSFETGGKYNFDNLDAVPGGSAKMIAELRIIMWQHTNQQGVPGTWFWEVFAVPHQISVNHWNFLQTFLQGEDTGKKYQLGEAAPDDDEGTPGIPDTPPDLVAAGGYNAYKIATTFLPTLFNFLNAYTPLESLVKMWSKPAEGIISLHMLPFDVHIAGNRMLSFHGVPIVYPVDSGTTLSAPTVDQWQEFNMGTVRLPSPKDYLNLSPFTTVSLFLPFIGMRELDADEVMGKSLRIDYRIDAVTGSTTVWVSIGNDVRYTFSGSCACSMPLSGTDWSQVYAAIGSAALGAVTGGLGAANSLISAGAGMGQIIGAGVAGGLATGLPGMAAAANKPLYQRISSLGNTTALNSCKEPYFIIESQDTAKPSTFEDTLGNPASRSVTLGSLAGFNVIQQLHLEGCTGTAAEANEIETLLGQGVYF